MTYQEIQDEVTTALADRLGIKAEDVNLDADLTDDINLDSLDRAELIMRLEETAGVKLDDLALEEIYTPRQLIDLVASLSDG